jgi:hypothetical protein
MDYNSNREKLPLPEYGRNIQNMVNHILTIEDRKERNRAARSIIDIMGNMYPYLRDIQDFKHKLWDHLAIMANFKLDIDYPYNPPSPEVFKAPPDKIPYGDNKIKYRHYGKTLEMMIEKAKDYEPAEERDVLIKLIANHMKKSYLSWNKNAVEDEKILLDLEELSEGKIKLTNYQLIEVKEVVQKPKKKKNNQRYKR